MLLPFSIRVVEWPPVWERAVHSVNCSAFLEHWSNFVVPFLPFWYWVWGMECNFINSGSLPLYLLSRKKPQFQKIRKLQNLIHFNERGRSRIEIFLVLNFDASSKCFERMKQSWPLSIGLMNRWTEVYRFPAFNKGGYLSWLHNVYPGRESPSNETCSLWRMWSKHPQKK